MMVIFQLIMALAAVCQGFRLSSDNELDSSGRALKAICSPGFFNDDGDCVKCQVPWCQVCQPPNGAQCTQCRSPYTLENNKCVMKGNDPVPGLAGDCDANCVVCNSPPTCQNCKVGYWNDNGFCKKCFDPNCVVCQPNDGSKCTQCKSPYVPAANGRCVLPTGRKLSEASCGDGDETCGLAQRQLKVHCPVPFCNQCVTHTICQNCMPGYFNDNGKCVVCKTQNCQVCQPPDGATCTQCKVPFTINHATGECVHNGIPNPNPPNGNCGPNCANCPGNGPSCQNCEEGYWNDNGFCKACATLNCRVCQPDNGATCTQCKAGYNLAANTCRV